MCSSDLPPARRGAIWAGRFERYVGLLEQFVWPLLGRWRIEGLFQQPDLASQARWFDARVGTRWLRAALRVAFSPALYRGRGVQDASLSRVEGGEPLGERFFRELRDVCTRTPARDNPLLQLMLLGRVLDVDHVPAWISAEGQAALRARAANLTFVDGDVIDLLRAAPPASFDALHLSNVSDWVDDARWSELLRGVLHAARPGARVVWRRMHAEHAVPEEVARGFARDDAAGMALRAADRFPFYAIHVAEVR